jgi:anaerobic selenocysteine-containing dehydrogenase
MDDAEAEANTRREAPSQTLRVVATVTVGRRTYHKMSRGNRRRMLAYEHPELRLSNRWLAAAGLKPGDRVVVANPKPGCLVILPAPAPTAVPARSVNGARSL